MATFDRRTGRIITGWPEVLQALNWAVRTPRKSRGMRRQLGSTLPRLIDRALSPITLIDFYAAIVDLVRDEPRFRITRTSLSAESDVASGRAIFDVEGVYYPRGHLGDYSIAEDVAGPIIVPIAS